MVFFMNLSNIWSKFIQKHEKTLYRYKKLFYNMFIYTKQNLPFFDYNNASSCDCSFRSTCTEVKSIVNNFLFQLLSPTVCNILYIIIFILFLSEINTNNETQQKIILNC